MAGRGFLKSRLAQITSKEPEKSPKPMELPKPVEPPKLEESIKPSAQSLPYPDVPKIPIPVISTQTLVAGNQQVVRGRRVIFLIIKLGKINHL